jgi:hypothetical protein
MKAALVIVVILALLLGAVMVAQQNQQIRISLQVPKAGSLALPSSPAAQSQQVSVHVTRPDSSDVSVIQMLARSNSRYRIQVGDTAVRIGRASVSPNAGGSRLMPDAMNVRTLLDLPGVLEGPRISNGGNNGTPDNALVISVPIEFPLGVSEADLSFRMEFLPN